ncbi:MAG: CaiB/BaiF CoA-transferase family protein [Syntrophomonas sp.]
MVLPLDGIRVLDLSMYLPGPLCSQILADFGAEVIKIEEPGGEWGRYLAPMLLEESARFYSVNRNKKSVGINLKSEEGKRVLKELVKSADVLIEQLRPGVLEKMGLGYDVLKGINPGLIHCAITGYGFTGPYRLVAGHDLNYLNLTGITGLNGPAETAALCAGQLADIAGGSLYAVIGILMALMARNKTSNGQFVDIAMADGALSLLCYTFGEWAGLGRLPARGENLLSGGYACYNVYETSDGRFVGLGAIESKFWEGFCQRVGKTDYIPWHFVEERQGEMVKDIRTIMKEKTQTEWVEIFADLDICFTPVLNLDEVVEHPQLKAREMMIKLDNFKNSGRDMYLTGIPVKLSETPGELKVVFSDIGQHTEEILSGAGFSQEEISKLRDQKAIR